MKTLENPTSGAPRAHRQQLRSPGPGATRWAPPINGSMLMDSRWDLGITKNRSGVVTNQRL